MAYSTPPTVITGDLWTAAQHNTYIRDNFAAGVPDIFSTKGDIAVATGADTATRLGAGTDGMVLTADSGQSTGVVYRPVVSYRKGGSSTVWNTGGTTDYLLSVTSVRIQVGSHTFTIANGTNGVAENVVFPIAFAYTPVVLVSQASNVGGGNRLVTLKASEQHAGYFVLHADLCDGVGVMVGNSAVTVHWLAIGQA